MRTTVLLLLIIVGCSNTPAQDKDISSSADTYIAMSQDFLIALMDGDSGESYVTALADIDLDDLASSLTSRAERLTFWINMYNALVQYRAVGDPSLFEDRGAFFTDPWVNIGGVIMSYDHLEHGIIRNSRVKLGLGYLKDWFAPAWERKLRNTETDGRVHFVLNCGAKSCPYVPILDDANYDADMDAYAKDYLSSITEVNGNVVKTSPLFSWFRGDFGGTSGVKELLHRYGIIDTTSDIELEYLPYDWTLETGNYTEL